jgi:DNA polymerase-3 subunit epsilon
MLLFGIDFETNSVDVTTAEITEIGGVLWDTATKAPLRIFSTLVWHENMPTLSPDIEFLTGLTNPVLEDWGVSPVCALNDLVAHLEAEGLQAVVAHNGTGFDKPLLENYAKRWGVEIPALHWIDTQLDIPFPAHVKTRKLTHLAAEHGFLNPFAHRAVFDVLTMFSVLSHYDAEHVLARSKEENIQLVAQTEKPWVDGGKSTGEAKARGFYWDGVLKLWLKTVKASQVAEETASAPFTVGVLKNGRVEKSSGQA